MQGNYKYGSTSPLEGKMQRVEKVSGGWRPTSLPSNEQFLVWENKVGMLYNLPTLSTLLMPKQQQQQNKKKPKNT